jgi:PD-(D/E)XK endonuclease
MRSATTGNAGEGAVLNALLQRGFDLLVPRRRELPPRPVKVAWPRGGCLIFNCRSTDHGHGPRSYAGLADIFGVFFPLNERVYLVPVDAVAPSEGRLRVQPTRNNQRRRIRDAAEFEVYKWSPSG